MDFMGLKYIYIYLYMWYGDWNENLYMYMGGVVFMHA